MLANVAFLPFAFCLLPFDFPFPLSLLLLFSVLAFAATEPWAVSVLQFGVFAQGIYCAMRRRLRWHPVGFAPAGVVVCGGLQLLTNSTVYRFATEQALLNWAAYFVLFVV